ncbi:hypothetical protein CCAX7_005150 [Capsulimonas corticalis]|uniref:Uncharacterized protein n=1 Tax=Capsulimonas corticalis TaxID=2219043 RepID=A0A402D308_9BACT|nr:hypothetical protein [Capsulimonas corticalis]BDI28464.1 hypothetical protein CCAX7_005150 [Capsulimonas corticalis]
MTTSAITISVAIVAVFFALAKFNARPGFNALALGLLLAFIPLLARVAPGHGDARNTMTFVALLVLATMGTVLGGGLKPREDDHHDHDHHHHGEAPHE